MKNLYSRILSLALALCLTAALAVPAFAEKAFTDIDSGHWAWDAVQTCAEEGIVNGFPDGSFKPEDPVTSVELVVLLTRTFYGDAVKNAAEGEAWYSPYVTAGDTVGVTQGLTIGETPMDRYDMAKALYNTMMMSLALKDDADAPSEDAIVKAPESIKDWDNVPQDRQTAVKYCYAYGIITGKDGGKFCGEDGMTRAEACMVMTRMMDLLSDDSSAPSVTEATTETDTAAKPTEPTETATKPTEAATEPTEAAAKPTEAATEPTEATTEPTEATTEPTEATTEPTEATTEPTEATTEPTEAATEPATEPEKPTGTVLPNGMELNDENVRSIIYGLKSQYPEGMRWTNDNSYTSNALRMVGYGCAGFALICSDAVFGDMPATGTHSNFDQIRVGDMLRVMNDTHSVVVLEKKADSVIVAEGNYNYSIHWGREITRAELERENFVATTRYPA